jgi:hypothetical protein
VVRSTIRKLPTKILQITNGRYVPRIRYFKSHAITARPVTKLIRVANIVAKSRSGGKSPKLFTN